jgi:hypothetical protein
MSTDDLVEPQRSAVVPAFAIAAALLAPSAQAAPLSFMSAELGMTLPEWRSLAPPEGAGPDAQPACSDDPRIATLAHSPLSATLQASDIVDCAYVDRFGETALTHSVLLDASSRANDLRYRFIRGRLVEIRFTASVDAYNDVTALLERQYGPPNETTRDAACNTDGCFARVIQTWRSPSGGIVLVDPSDDPAQLRVSDSAGDHDDRLRRPRPGEASARCRRK